MSDDIDLIANVLSCLLQVMKRDKMNDKDLRHKNGSALVLAAAVAQQIFA